jgi:hypothetical protein
MANTSAPYMAKSASRSGKAFKNVRIYHASWEKVIGNGKMYETFAEVLDRILDQYELNNKSSDEGEVTDNLVGSAE